MSIVPPEPDSNKSLDDAVELRVHEPDLWWSQAGLWHPEHAAIGPDESSVYWLWSHGLLLYVGSTQSPHRRWMQHANTKGWWREVRRIEQLVVPSHGMALMLEDDAIRTQKPLYNRTGPWAAQRRAVQRRGLDNVLDEVGANLGMPS